MEITSLSFAEKHPIVTSLLTGMLTLSISLVLLTSATWGMHELSAFSLFKILFLAALVVGYILFINYAFIENKANTFVEYNIVIFDKNGNKTKIPYQARTKRDIEVYITKTTKKHGIVSFDGVFFINSEDIEHIEIELIDK